MVHKGAGLGPMDESGTTALHVAAANNHLEIAAFLIAHGADLNSGLFRSAHIPDEGIDVSVEFQMIGVLFADEDGTFSATTPDGFSPEQTADASTVVGPGEAVIVDGDASTQYAFPGGLDLNSFVIAVPQVRIGSFRGTEALIRYIALELGTLPYGLEPAPADAG